MKEKEENERLWKKREGNKRKDSKEEGRDMNKGERNDSWLKFDSFKMIHKHNHFIPRWSPNIII